MANTNYIDSFEVNGVEIPVRDPGISQWAREPSAPEYTAENVGAFPDEDRRWTGMENAARGSIVLQDLYRCPVDTDRCGGDHEHTAKRAWAAGQ